MGNGKSFFEQAEKTEYHRNDPYAVRIILRKTTEQVLEPGLWFFVL